MTLKPRAGGLQKNLRYVPLLAAGVLVFVGIVKLGGLTGLLWESFTFGVWKPLNPSLLGQTEDWFIWGASFLFSISPGILALDFRRIGADPPVVLASFIFPLLSLVALSWSYFVGGTLLVGSGFLAAYTLISRSKTQLGLNRGFALRLVCTEVFGFLTLAAAGGVLSILLWRDDVVYGLISRGLNIWPSILVIDMEVFYLTRPLLLAMFMLLGLTALMILIMDPTSWILKRTLKRTSDEHAGGRQESPHSSPPQSKIRIRSGLPYLVLAGSIVLGIVFTQYPYITEATGNVPGSDIWFYAGRLQAMASSPNPLQALEADRAFSVLVLFAIMRLANLDVGPVLALAPSLLAGLLALSSFALVNEGTRRPWLAAFAALLSVVSAQTSLGMGAGLLANWFSLSLLNFMFALAVRAIRLHSRLATLGSIIVSLFLLASYAYLWVAAVAMLGIVLIVTVLRFRSANHVEWKSESTFLAAVLAGTFSLPIILLYVVATPLLGFRPAWFDPSVWLNIGWTYISGHAGAQVLVSAPAAIEGAFVFAGNRIDLPILTILSIFGLVNSSSQTGSFRKIVASMILVPLSITLISPGAFETWRGLYLIPIYLTGALGVESVIRILNGRMSTWNSRGRLALTGTFVAYVFLTHLAYSLRALDLLIYASRYVL